MTARARYIAIRDRQIGLEFAARAVRRAAEERGCPADVATELAAIAEQYAARAEAMDPEIDVAHEAALVEEGCR